ncbi:MULTISPECIES: asparagine synthase C-terminal domain-containing protein [unclassified Gemella]|uniref:asparagine synthase C-terminal domain-containing protein n=1 Tax=unclassified Gemella TaxID=2624949 RepID=UPI0015CFB719|nr:MULTISPECIES: asparagine synthase C-terminal domain-containing protein [unclassified Gemella]MBF0710682.1 asparagine synthase [Gemella sp. GL1.1]NYS28026.1 asparagine synthase [Gemella sp. GL1]
METCNKNNIKSILVNTDYLTSFYNFPNDSPITQVPYCNVATYGAQKIIYETAKRVLTGLGGDEVLSGTNYFNHDLFFSGHILKAFRNIGNLSRNRQEPLIYNIKKYILSPLKSKNKYSYGRKKEIKRIKENLLPMITEYISDVNNITVRHPYLDRELIEFMLSLPVQYKISRTGYKKYLLRIAMKEIIPDSILNRLDKTSHFGIIFGIIYGGLKKEWSKLSKILNNDNYLEFKRKYGLDNSNLDDINFDLWAMGRDGNELAWPLVSMMIWEYKVGKKYDKFTKYK